MALERYRETFNDGMLQYGAYKTRRNENRKRTGRVFVPQGQLPFRILNARDSDYTECGTLGSSLDLKIKTPTPPMLRNKVLNQFKVKIENDEYDVIKGDRDKYYLYFYLHRVGVNNGE